MAILLMILIVLHVVPGVFWAGSTFVLARDPMMGDRSLGDYLGSPGTAMTFFGWPRWPRPKVGSGQVTTVAFAVPTSSHPRI